MSEALVTTMVGIARPDDPIASLYVTHYSELVGLARVLLRDHHVAEEVVQEAFVRVQASWRGVRDPARAAAYLRSAVLNQARSLLRRSKVAAAHSKTPSPVGGSMTSVDPSERAVAADQREVLLSEIRLLPTRQRECVVLRYYLDLSEAEMAETLRISTGSVKTHLSRGLAALADRLKEIP